MAEAEPHSLSSTFPNPPPFWHDFTPEKTARAETLSSNAESLPPDLVNLRPPREPADGRWRVFGDQYMLDDKLPTLEEQGIDNLRAAGPSSSRTAKHYDRALELKRIAKSLLLNFLELIGLLSRSPSHAETKMQHLRTLFINMHHVLNEYRPHQARESAMELMQDHLDRTRAETLAIHVSTATINRFKP
ncbi:mediator of RNA polymerase II transcription subunit 7 [Ophiocordyceps camponoti-floridani]|uniref:Mediator of RNA polymerase II transcription subunit 7 n=1 Tax=Ophiocordyceps camponoti-floridani TaxID=2030778 RepID=A0A8H4QDT6_9HYPO|nr:mediator of RNA polymerase II transcription subunit 7 [Ophiocordyceps camponoti-floridani]